MKHVFPFLLMLLSFSVTATPHGVKGNNFYEKGRNRIFRQQDGKFIAVSSLPGIFYSMRLYASGNSDPSYKGHESAYNVFRKDSRLANNKTIGSALQADDKLIMAGAADIIADSGRIAVMVRLTSSGVPDSSFQSGIIRLLVGKQSEFHDVCLLPDGKILATGLFKQGPSFYSFTARFLPNGSPDNSFGINGVATDRIPLAASCLLTMTLQADGKYVIMGNYHDDEPFIKRYNSDGNPDELFGTNGTATITGLPLSQLTATHILFQSGNKMLIAGNGIENGRNRMFLIRLTDDGHTDETFGSQGYVIAGPEYNSRLDDILQNTDGRIFLAGAGAERNGNGYSKYILLRLSPNGEPDSTYGYGSDAGFTAYALRNGHNIYTNNIVVSGPKIFGLSELMPPDESQIVTVIHEFLAGAELGRIDIPEKKLQYNVYPNPVTTRTTFSFELHVQQHVTIRLTDVNGKEVFNIANGQLYEVGENKVTIDFPSFAVPGTYLLVLMTDLGYKVTVRVTKL